MALNKGGDIAEFRSPSETDSNQEAETAKKRGRPKKNETAPKAKAPAKARSKKPTAADVKKAVDKVKAKQAAVPPDSDKKPATKADQKDAVDGYVAQLAKISNKQINDWCKRMQDIDAERKALNDDAAEIRAEAKDAGIIPADFAAIYTRYKSDPIKRVMRDAAIARGIRAMNEQMDFGF
jgi:uncharacterized protein (UPF0335 family)